LERSSLTAALTRSPISIGAATRLLSDETQQIKDVSGASTSEARKS